MLSGAFGDPARILAALETGDANDIATAIRPLTETLVAATPLIFTGLAVAISFRAGMFNIGVDGPAHPRCARRDDRGLRAPGPGAAAR